MEKRWKCHTCHTITTTNPCGCGETVLEVMCELDHCKCTHEFTDGIAYCPTCKKAMCPVCGCHDVAQISRVTGYLQDVGGWNHAKQQELKDRTRYDALTGMQVTNDVR